MNYTTTERDLATAYARTYAGQGELLSKLGVVRADLPETAQEDPIEEYKTCQAIAPEMKRINLDEIVSKAKPLNPNIGNKITDTPN
jgi:adhesin transport system outer membrane protein